MYGTLQQKIIFLDTQTTGIDRQKDRITEIYCAVYINGKPTGEAFHIYLNPECVIPENIIQITGLTNKFLMNKPKFADIGHNFAKFIDNAHIVVHQADFDISMINAEFARMGIGPIKNPVTCTKIMSEVIFGTKQSLNDMCKKFNVDLSRRGKDHSLRDSVTGVELLVAVYFELLKHQGPSTPPRPSL